MSLSKAVIMGNVIRNPEKRFTTNNVPITSFTIDISNNDEESLVRIITKGKLAETTSETVKKDKMVIVEGRLQTNTVKTSAGAEKKIVEVDAQSVEVLNNSTQASSQSEEEDFKFDDDTINDDLIGEDEIPF